MAWDLFQSLEKQGKGINLENIFTVAMLYYTFLDLNSTKMTSIMAEEEESNIIGTSFSLVRYNNPVLIDKHDEVNLY